jgi:hypothetical protein
MLFRVITPSDLRLPDAQDIRQHPIPHQHWSLDGDAASAVAPDRGTYGSIPRLVDDIERRFADPAELTDSTGGHDLPDLRFSSLSAEGQADLL